LSNSAVRDLAARSKPFHGFNSSASSEESVPASKDSFGRIHYDWKQSRLTFTNNSILFLNNFLVGPEGLGRKNFEIETQRNYKRDSWGIRTSHVDGYYPMSLKGSCINCWGHTETFIVSISYLVSSVIP
jgi:hypothetical protein